MGRKLGKMDLHEPCQEGPPTPCRSFQLCVCALAAGGSLPHRRTGDNRAWQANLGFHLFEQQHSFISAYKNIGSAADILLFRPFLPSLAPLRFSVIPLLLSEHLHSLPVHPALSCTHAPFVYTLLRYQDKSRRLRKRFISTCDILASSIIH
jgi:hypothetical protein